MQSVSSGSWAPGAEGRDVGVLPPWALEGCPAPPVRSTCPQGRQEAHGRVIPCDHQWGQWHWFITSPGWTRRCKRCGAFDPDHVEADRRYAEGFVPPEDERCSTCLPHKPCWNRGSL